MSIVARVEPTTGIVLYRCTVCRAATGNFRAARRHTLRECYHMLMEATWPSR